MSEAVNGGPVYYICPTCDGQGGMGDDCICPDCDGAGHRQAHIIPGANAVVTPKGLKDAAKAMTDWLGIQFVWKKYDRLTDSEKAVVREAARLALINAGITCVDEVVEVQVFAGDDDVYVSVPSRDGEESYVELHDGDKLHIQRAKTQDGED